MLQTEGYKTACPLETYSRAGNIKARRKFNMQNSEKTEGSIILSSGKGLRSVSWKK